MGHDTFLPQPLKCIIHDSTERVVVYRQKLWQIFNFSRQLGLPTNTTANGTLRGVLYMSFKGVL